MAGSQGQPQSQSSGRDKYNSFMDVAAPLAATVASAYGSNAARAAQIGLGAYDSSRRRGQMEKDRAEEIKRYETEQQKNTEYGKRLSEIANNRDKQVYEADMRLYNAMTPEEVKKDKATVGVADKFNPQSDFVGPPPDDTKARQNVDTFMERFPEPVQHRYYAELGELAKTDPVRAERYILDAPGRKAAEETRMLDLLDQYNADQKKQADTDAAREFQRQTMLLNQQASREDAALRSKEWDRQRQVSQDLQIGTFEEKEKQKSEAENKSKAEESRILADEADVMAEALTENVRSIEESINEIKSSGDYELEKQLPALMRDLRKARLEEKQQKAKAKKLREDFKRYGGKEESEEYTFVYNEDGTRSGG